MIIKASQRGNAGELARHLSNTQDNEHVTLHKLEQMSADTLRDALMEIEATAAGTRCKQPLFHCSFNPPANQNVSTQEFEEAAKATAKKLGLQDQPYAFVFHEKQGRRHAHVVWSRIDAEHMRAIHLPFFKNRLTELTKEIYLSKGWTLPHGLIDKSLRNPLNFTLTEWQQAKRSKSDPRLIKQILQKHWLHSKNQKIFEHNIEQHGLKLARGDKRGYVVVNWQGEVHSLSRQLGMKAKDLKSQLDPTDTLPSVDEVKAAFDQEKIKKLNHFLKEVEKRYVPKFKDLRQQRQAMQRAHKQARHHLKEKQQRRQQAEQEERQQRFNKGLRGFWDKIIGRKNRIEQRNQYEAYQALLRDQQERDHLIYSQLQERQELQQQIDKQRADIHQEREHAVTTMFEQERPKEIEQHLQRTKQRSIKRDFNLSL
ncbi:relaxase/mobilization nuclease domain-containing protein [Agarilytica rhodophyticola]|uniref:relaxase/mobilization nuclease domain-containing protein n=1 Tax=Agarilytica rhodophyticola TaxID=1737490 RepID=UPI000B349E90|nr:relaxase/mobilization nuclease domain-containing protein [Agarilytica rhodophyticola]